MLINKFLVCLSVICIILLDCGFSIRWLSLQYSQLHWNSTSTNFNPIRGSRSGIRSPCVLARKKYGLAKLQAKLCRNSIEIMPHVQKAAVLTSQTCQAVFENRRWNCSSIKTAPHLTSDLTTATREQAYVYALSSAALTYTLARACASSHLYQCTCAGKPEHNDPGGNFQWGGCGDNINWAVQVAKRFTDNMEKVAANKSRSKINWWTAAADNTVSELEESVKIMHLRKQIALMNLNNNKIGRKIIAESLQIQCKCHGMSGSCSIKTCWKALPVMLQIGQKLLHRYTNALEVVKKNRYDAINKKKLFIGGRKHSDQLVYITKSPDYCTKDERLGSYGTIGRTCNVSSNGPESCRQLCCGRGYRTVIEEKIERCQCKYYYCCYVKCKICRSKTKKYECS